MKKFFLICSLLVAVGLDTICWGQPTPTAVAQATTYTQHICFDVTVTVSPSNPCMTCTTPVSTATLPMPVVHTPVTTQKPAATAYTPPCRAQIRILTQSPCGERLYGRPNLPATTTRTTPAGNTAYYTQALYDLADPLQRKAAEHDLAEYRSQFPDARFEAYKG